jgi:RNA polymerase sigma factor (sigma-70 family)
MSTLFRQKLVETDAVAIGRSLMTPEAFGEVFDRHWHSVYRYCGSRAGAEGEDLAAETFRLAFDRRETYDLDRPDAGPWLLGLATNLIRNHLRGRHRGKLAAARLLEFDDLEDVTDLTIGRVEAAQLGPSLTRALDGIPSRDRDALLLMAWNGLSYEEVAEALDIPVGTVRSRISRARLRLRAQLAELGYRPEGVEPQPSY